MNESEFNLTSYDFKEEINGGDQDDSFYRVTPKGRKKNDITFNEHNISIIKRPEKDGIYIEDLQTDQMEPNDGGSSARRGSRFSADNINICVSDEIRRGEPLIKTELIPIVLEEKIECEEMNVSESNGQIPAIKSLGGKDTSEVQSNPKKRMVKNSKSLSNFSTLKLMNPFVTGNYQGTLASKRKKMLEYSSELQPIIDSPPQSRLNENGNYEFKFGNDVIGKSIPDGCVVSITYLITNGSAANKANNFVATATLADSLGNSLTNFTID